MPAQRSWAIVLLALTLAGCTQTGTDDGDDGGAEPGLTPGTTDLPGFLAALDTPVKPDAQRLVDDLRTFTALAPRRYENQFQHEDARAWLETQFKDAGLLVERQSFAGVSQNTGLPTPGENIIATKPGTDPDVVIVFGAHYDSAVSAYGAAYDDGSGTLIVVELARALAPYTFRHTLVFAEFDQEESGLIGSAAYVQALVEDGTKHVDLMLNYDMAGINWPAKFGGAVDVPVKVDFGGAGGDQYAAAWGDVVAHLGQPATSSAVAVAANGSSGPSDHGSFWAADLPAAWVRGAVIGNYPMYHNADQVDTMVVDVGGNEEDLVAGFDTVLTRSFLFTFVVDGMPAAA